jgi:hypothetical protein
MKKIFLLIIFIIILIKCEFPSSCEDCSAPDCICPSGKYQLEGLLKCCPDNIVIEGYILIRDESEAIYKKCHPACLICEGLSVEGSQDTKCRICNNGAGYYMIDNSYGFCKNAILDEEFLKGYYFDPTSNLFKHCHSNCLTCDIGEDEENHNCKECRPYYYKYDKNCYLNCPSDLFIYGYSCLKICSDHGLFEDFFSRRCVDENQCPEGTKAKDGICVIETTNLYENLDCYNIIEDVIFANMKYFMSSNSFIPGKNCYLQIYNAMDQNQVHKIAERKYLSKLFLSSEYLNSDTIVIKIDYNKTYMSKPEVNDVTFILYKKYDENYVEITDLDLISRKDTNDLIYIEKPFIFLQNIQKYKDKYEIFDIFNARDEVYNNFCKDFITEYNTDLTYDYRRDSYFVNISDLCLNDSTQYYSGFNAKTTSIQCKANYIENKFTGEKKVGSSRFKVFNCRKYLAKNLGANAGFWMIFFIILFNFGLGYYFWRAPFINIINFMRIFEREFNKPTGLKLKYTVLNPPKKRMKIIYEPKEFIIDKKLNEQENEIQFGRYLNNYYKQRQDKLEQLNNNNPEGVNKTNINIEGEKDYELTSSSNKNISFSKGSNSSTRRARKIEEEKRIIAKKKKEYLNFIEDAHRKDKAIFANMVYNQPLGLEKNDMDKAKKDYHKRQNKINEEKVVKTNLLHLDNVGNVVRDPSVEIPKLNMKYEPKEYLDKYMFHNYEHLLPVPKSERISSGSLSSDIRHELMKLQQLREKQMVETIFLKKLVYNKKLIKGYNEDFYPFSFDECIIRRQEGLSYLIVFWNYLREINLIANVIFDENYLENRYLKIILLGFEFYSFIFFNLLFYSDDYINDFYIHKGKYNFFYQLTKSIYSTFCTAIIIKMSLWLISCKDSFRKVIITQKYESDFEYRNNYKFFIILLIVKIGFFYAILVLSIIYGWVYYMCFSVPYRQSQGYVLVGTIFSILIYEILSIGIVALVSRLKYVSIKDQHRKLYNILMILNKFL